MNRQINIYLTGKFPKKEHVFSSRKHLSLRSYKKQTVETFLTKRIKAKDEEVITYYQTHIYGNIISWLRKSSGIDISALSISESMGEFMIQAVEREITPQNQGYDYSDSDNESEEKKEIVDGLTLFLTKKLIYGKSLTEMIAKKDKRLTPQFCIDLVGNMVDFLFTGGGVKDLMLTTDNIIVEDSGSFHLNYLSFTGLDFFRLERYISKEEFEELLPYLTMEFIKEKQPKISVEMQLKFIMLNFYSAFFRRQIVFDPKQITIDIEVKRTTQIVQKLVKKTEEELMRTLFNLYEEDKMREFDTKNGVKYRHLLNQLLVSDSEDRKENMNWEFILSKLSHREGQPARDRSQESEKGFVFYKLVPFKDRLDRNYDRFAFNVLEMVDVYLIAMKTVALDMQKLQKWMEEKKRISWSQSEFQTTLVTKVLNKERLKIKQKQIIQKDDLDLNNYRRYKELTKQAPQLVAQRQSLIQDERYSKSLYIPIKTGMRFTSILKYYNWVEMLQKASQTDNATLDAITKLLKFTNKIGQNMKLIIPLIDLSFLSFMNRHYKLKDKNQYYFIKFLKHLTEEQIQKKSKINSNLSGFSMNAENTDKNLRQQFQNVFFWILDGLNLLAKEFFNKTTEHSIYSDRIRINRQEFGPLIKRIEAKSWNTQEKSTTTVDYKSRNLFDSAQILGGALGTTSYQKL